MNNMISIFCLCKSTRVSKKRIRTELSWTKIDLNLIAKVLTSTTRLLVAGQSLECPECLLRSMEQ